jgi:flagellar basal-body rod protein FlgG
MDGIDWAAGAMLAARDRLDVATGNLSNVSTDGFHKALAQGRLTADGVEIARVTSDDRGAYRKTGNPYDLAIVGDGAFRMRDARGRMIATRDGSFERDRFGALRDSQGRALLGLRGPVRVPDGATIDERGRIMVHGVAVDRILSGRDSTVRSGFIETSDVNAIDEMVCVLTSQRSFESAQKVVSAIDGVRQKSANDVARVK